MLKYSTSYSVKAKLKLLMVSSDSRGKHFLFLCDLSTTSVPRRRPILVVVAETSSPLIGCVLCTATSSGFTNQILIVAASAAPRLTQSRIWQVISGRLVKCCSRGKTLPHVQRSRGRGPEGRPQPACAAGLDTQATRVGSYVL